MRIPPALAWAALRALLCSPFLVSGLVKLADPEAAATEVAALTGLSPAMPIALAVIALQLGGSAMVIAGGRLARPAALALALFTLAATVLAHGWWLKPGRHAARDLMVFWEHMGLAAGLLMVAFGVGRWPRTG